MRVGGIDRWREVYRGRRRRIEGLTGERIDEGLKVEGRTEGRIEGRTEVV